MGKDMTLRELMAEIEHADSIVLTAHENPDGDALGSTLGLMHILRSMGKKADVFIDDKLPFFLSYLPGYGTIRRPEKMEADLLLVLDTGVDRIGTVLDKVVPAHVINIDHHKTNAGEELAHHIEPEAAATCEIIYKLVKEMQTSFTEEAAVCLYTGMATDTGFFRYSNTSSYTMRAAAEMIEAGAVPNVISEALDEKPYQTVLDTAHALNHIERFADGKAAGIFLDYETTSSMETTEGFIDYVRVIEGVEIAVVMKMKAEQTARVSMRSKGADVSSIAASFDGGGHTRAAGCTLKMPFDKAEDTIKKAITSYFEAHV